MQLMAYKTLFDGLVRRGVDPGGRLSARIGLRRDAAVSEDVAARVAEVLPALGADTRDGVVTLGDVFDAVSRSFARIEPSAETLFVEYEWQRGGEPLGSASFDHDERWFTARAKTHVSFWDGSRDAGSASAAGRPVVHGVADDEAWKCERCRFSGDCPTAAVFAERWERERRASKALGEGA